MDNDSPSKKDDDERRTSVPTLENSAKLFLISYVFKLLRTKIDPVEGNLDPATSSSSKFRRDFSNLKRYLMDNLTRISYVALARAVTEEIIVNEKLWDRLYILQALFLGPGVEEFKLYFSSRIKSSRNFKEKMMITVRLRDRMTVLCSIPDVNMSLRILHIDFVGNDDILKCLASHCPNLEELSVSYCEKVTSVGIYFLIGIELVFREKLSGQERCYSDRHLRRKAFSDAIQIEEPLLKSQRVAARKCMNIISRHHNVGLTRVVVAKKYQEPIVAKKRDPTLETFSIELDDEIIIFNFKTWGCPRISSLNVQNSQVDIQATLSCLLFYPKLMKIRCDHWDEIVSLYKCIIPDNFDIVGYKKLYYSHHVFTRKNPKNTVVLKQVSFPDPNCLKIYLGCVEASFVELSNFPNTEIPDIREHPEVTKLSLDIESNDPEGDDSPEDLVKFDFSVVKYWRNLTWLELWARVMKTSTIFAIKENCQKVTFLSVGFRVVTVDYELKVSSMSWPCLRSLIFNSHCDICPICMKILHFVLHGSTHLQEVKLNIARISLSLTQVKCFSQYLPKNLLVYYTPASQTSLEVYAFLVENFPKLKRLYITPADEDYHKICQYRRDNNLD